MLELFQNETHNLDYVAIPMNLYGDTPSAIRSGVASGLVELPRGSELSDQISLQQLCDLFSGDLLYQYLCIALQEWTECKVTCYTAMGESFYDQLFQDHAPSEYLIGKITSINSTEDAERFFQLYYYNSHSNLSLDRKMSYASGFAQISPSLIYLHELPVKEKDGVATVSKKTKTFLKGLQENEAYTVTQEQYQEILEVDDQTLIIQILNGTNVTGLAARCKERLEKEGYYVMNVGNYEEGYIDRTRIYVKEKGTGTALKRYFHDPLYEVVSTLPNQVEVQIVLGSDDSDE